MSCLITLTYSQSFKLSFLKKNILTEELPVAFTHLNCWYELSFASLIMCKLVQEFVGVPRIYYGS